MNRLMGLDSSSSLFFCLIAPPFKIMSVNPLQADPKLTKRMQPSKLTFVLGLTLLQEIRPWKDVDISVIGL